MHSVEVLTQFVEAINRHDAKALVALMTVDHLFVDSLGNVVRGALTMEAGWAGYFSMCPDYWIRMDEVMEEAGVVLARERPVGRLMGSRGGHSQRGRL
jgi:ketosteroid isomerase-like protein